MGIYSNYSMIISTISRVLSQVSQSVIGSVGNLMVQDDDQYKYGVYKEMMFINFAVYFTICVVLGSAAERFIHLWVGEAGVMSPWITFVVLMNFYMTGMRQTNILVIDSSGLFSHIKAEGRFRGFHQSGGVVFVFNSVSNGRLRRAAGHHSFHCGNLFVVGTLCYF